MLSTDKIEVRISFEEFKRIMEYDFIVGNTRNFRPDRFEYYECGAYGLGWCTYGFKTKEDLKQYKIIYKLIKQKNI